MAQPSLAKPEPWEGRLLAAAIGGGAGVVVSCVSLFLTAACCSGSIVDEGSPAYALLRALSFGLYVAGRVDRSGGWATLAVFLGVSFVGWALLATSVCWLLQLVRGARA